MSRFSAGAIGVWTNGVMNFTSAAASFNRELTKAIPDGPYTNLQVGLKMTDSLDSRSLQSLDMNEATSGACGASCTAKILGSTLNMRYGRLRLEDAFGPETVNLPVNFITEYWTGNYFALNANDSCTIIPRSAVTYPTGTLVLDSHRTVSVGSGSTQGMYNNLDATGIHFSAGVIVWSVFATRRTAVRPAAPPPPKRKRLYFLSAGFFCSSASFFTNFLGSFLKSFRQSLQQSLISCPSCVKT